MINFDVSDIQVDRFCVNGRANNPLLTEMIADSAKKAATKESRRTPNVANTIAAYLRKRCPELCDYPGLWFSGSTVWKFLYGETPDWGADLDVFFLRADSPDDPRDGLRKYLGIPDTDYTYANVLTGFSEDYYAQGMKAVWKGAKLDVWESGKTVAESLRYYPTRTHSHCRAAFSFTEGLVVLPNEHGDK